MKFANKLADFWGKRTMARVAKYSGETNVMNILRHNDRLPETYKNKDVDLTRSHQNVYLSPTRGMSSWSYYRKRLGELYVYKHRKLVTLCEWIVTCPKGLTEEEMHVFFQLTYRFLVERYHEGEASCIQAVVHRDETQWSGHMHFTWIPTVPDKKHGGAKVCCVEVLNRTELRDFHPALQKFMIDHGLPQARVVTGIMKEQDRSYTVEEQKQTREKKQAESPVAAYNYEPW